MVFVHGIGQQGSDRDEQERLWFPSLVKGVLFSGHRHADRIAADLTASCGAAREPLCGMAFYGDRFLPLDVQGGDTAVSAEVDAIADELARAVLETAATRGNERSAAEALQALTQADTQLDEVQGPGAITRNAIAVLDDHHWLASRIFGLAQRARPDLTQVARYLADADLRARILQLAADLIKDDTVLVIGHSLGSVVAWEAGHQLSRPLPMLITLGSPLGLGSVVYPRLHPQPPSWPPNVDRWVNVAHRDDFIAVEPRLAPLFQSTDGRLVEDHELVSKHEHHGIAGYLERPETGLAVAEALARATDAAKQPDVDLDVGAADGPDRSP
ncbi:lipase family protein [Geodermatophilus obscurus]|nr:lipase family protein [Geodermatophilus obscurus]